MQGIYGLNALRVKVKTGNRKSAKQSLSDVEKAVKSFESVN
jgi:hypothetical protein